MSQYVKRMVELVREHSTPFINSFELCDDEDIAEFKVTVNGHTIKARRNESGVLLQAWRDSDNKLVAAGTATLAEVGWPHKE